MSRLKRPRRKPVSTGSRSPTGIGNKGEQKQFLTSNPARTSAIENIYKTAKKVFLRTLTSNAPADRVGFYLGRICVDDFSEIVLLAGNGYGIGALKILRGMYERAVTAAYLLANPEEAHAFMEYEKVNRHRAYEHAKKLGSYGPKLTEEAIKRIEDEFEAVKPMFLNGKRVRGSWTKLDTASLAQRAGAGYEQLYFNAFYKPTLELHSTSTSVLNRLELTRDGRLSFDGRPQRVDARHAIVMAHNLLLRVLDSQNTHFGLGLDEVIQTNVAEFQKAYASVRTGED